MYVQPKETAEQEKKRYFYLCYHEFNLVIGRKMTFTT